jgi:hypothetical protein
LPNDKRTHPLPGAPRRDQGEDSSHGETLTEGRVAGCGDAACCASSFSECERGESVGKSEYTLRPDELAHLVNESVLKRLVNGQDLAGVVPLCDLFGSGSSSLPHDRFVGLLIPVHHLDILLQFCTSELGLRFECPSRRVYEEATGRIGVSAGTGQEYRDGAGVNNTCAVCQQLEVERQEVIVENESRGILSSSRGECQIHHFRRVLLDQIRSELAESTGRLLIDLGMEVDHQGRLVFKSRIHESDFLHNVERTHR